MNLEQAREMLTAYLNAETAVLAGKTVTFNGRTVSRENLAEIRAGRQEWQRKVASLEQAQSKRSKQRFKLARF